MKYSQSSFQHLWRGIRFDKASDTVMRIKILHAFWVRLMVGFLLTMQPKVIFGQRQFSQNFEVAKAWPNYCPNETDAIGTYHERSRFACVS